MSFVLHDKNGYICELASATACLLFFEWLGNHQGSGTVSLFLKEGTTAHPRKLANEIADLLKDDPPTTHVQALAEEYIKGLRRARGYAMLTH
jgi:hypothetical protein